MTDDGERPTPQEVAGMTSLDAVDLELLQRRTEALARSSGAVETRRGIDVVVVCVGAARYAFPTSSISAVAALRRLTPLPRAGPELAGLTGREGRVLLAFHLRSLLGLPLEALPEHGRMVLLGEGEAQLALVVDSVEGFERIDEGSLVDPPHELSRVGRDLILGVDPRGFALLDVQALLADGRLVVDIPLPRGDGLE